MTHHVPDNFSLVRFGLLQPFSREVDNEKLLDTQLVRYNSQKIQMGGIILRTVALAMVRPVSSRNFTAAPQ